jgi:large subunit ribosomal protein L25
MSQYNLKVSPREMTGKEANGRLRRSGEIPAVAYGHKEEPVKLQLNAKELRDLMAHGHGRGLLNLQQEGAPSLPVIIKSVTRNPKTHNVESVDFLRVSMNEKVTANVPIVLEGTPDAVRVEGGILVQAMQSLEVTAFPQDIPEHINVDVTGLVFNGAPIHVREIVLPANVVAVTDGEEAVAVVNPPDVEPIVEVSMTAEEIAEAESADVNPMVNSEAGKEDVTTGDKSDTGEKPGK